MSRRSRSYSNRRVTSSNANRRLPINLSLPPSVQSVIGTRLSITPIEDRRTFHPMGSMRPARSLTRLRHNLVAQNRRLSNDLTPRIANPFRNVPAFQNSLRVLICHRRQVRKEVLHAIGKSGKTGQRRPRRNYYSSVSC